MLQLNRMERSTWPLWISSETTLVCRRLKTTMKQLWVFWQDVLTKQRMGMFGFHLNCKSYNCSIDLQDLPFFSALLRHDWLQYVLSCNVHYDFFFFPCSWLTPMLHNKNVIPVILICCKQIWTTVSLKTFCILSHLMGHENWSADFKRMF